jgi:hypothetical protein
MDFYRDKQSGELFSEEEMLDIVDENDPLDSFYLVGNFNSRDEAEAYLMSM